MIAPPKPPSHDELEALIKEARARQLRRRLLAAAGVAIAAGLGLGVYAVATGGANRAGTASGGRPQVVTAPCSAAAGWQLRLDGVWSEPTGQHTAPLAITRVGGSACTLAGYPKIVLVSPQSKKLGFRYSHHGDLVVAARPPRAVHVAGNGSAYFLLNKYRCDARDTGIARWMRVTLPGVRGQLVLHLPRYPILDYCGARGPSTTIAVSPIVANLARAAARLP
jgi:Protein of unknown function (DUF4232)